MYNMLLLFETRFETVFLISFKFNSFQISSSQKTKKPLEKFVRNIKSGDVFYNNDRT